MQVRRDEDLQVQILGHMVRPIQDLVDGLDARAADPVSHGLAVMLADDLDRHLTVLTDSPIAVSADRHVLEIEVALERMRARLASVQLVEIG